MTWKLGPPTIRGPYWLRRTPESMPMLVFATPTTPNDWWYYPIYSTRGDRVINLDKDVAVWWGPVEPPSTIVDNSCLNSHHDSSPIGDVSADTRILDGEVE